MLKMMKVLVVLVSVLTAASVFATDDKPAASAGVPVTRLTVVTGQAAPSPKDSSKRLTPQVLVKILKKAEKSDAVYKKWGGDKNKIVNEEWLGNLDLIYGHYTSATANEALVISREGNRPHSDGDSHVWLVGQQGGQWAFLRKLAVWDEVTVEVLDVNGDGIDEVMISGSGGNGMAHHEGTLYSFKDNQETILYENEGHDNWIHSSHPEFKKNILERLYTVSFTKPDAAGVRTLVEQQTLLMGKRISKQKKDSAPSEQFEENGNKYVTTRFNLENGVYRPVPGSAVTTKKPVELKTVTDKTVRVSAGGSGN